MLPLRFDFIALGIIELHARRLREAEDVDIRNAVRLAGVDGGEHLVGGPARIGLAIGHTTEIGRQHAAEPAAENRYDDVALRGFWYLRLEGLVRLVELRLPADRHDMYDALELAVEPLGHPLQPLRSNCASPGEDTNTRTSRTPSAMLSLPGRQQLHRQESD